MKIISQIDENTFVVRMEEIDLNNNNPQHVFVAHDYFAVSDYRSITTDPTVMKQPIYGPHKFCGNSVMMWQQCHISIREMINLVLPYLNEHPYLKPEHLISKEDGSQRYLYCAPANLYLSGCESITKDNENHIVETRVSHHYRGIKDGGGWNVEPRYEVEEIKYTSKFVVGEIVDTESTETYIYDPITKTKSKKYETASN